MAANINGLVHAFFVDELEKRKNCRQKYESEGRDRTRGSETIRPVALAIRRVRLF